MRWDSLLTESLRIARRARDIDLVGQPGDDIEVIGRHTLIDERLLRSPRRIDGVEGSRGELQPFQVCAPVNFTTTTVLLEYW